MGARGATARGSGAAFVPTGAGETPRAAQSAPVAAMTGLDAILALQAVEDPLLKKRKAVQRGRHVLDALDGMKADLLIGQVNPGRLDQILGLIATARDQCEPGLDAVLDEIELRARVELAKFGRF